MHFGLTHGFVTTERGPDKDLPFNKRFFPGGDSSIRGYQYGEASPKNDEGKIVGAESFGLANVEFEQALTRSISIVFFVDSLGYAQSIRDYPFNHGLFSAGGGFSFKTLIGPARLPRPRQRELVDVVGGDLRQLAVALTGVVAVVGRPAV